MATEIVRRIAREKAAQAWCTPATKTIEMDARLAEAFADIIDEIWSRPWLGNATTGEMLDEIKARVDCSYRTVGPHAESPTKRTKRCLTISYIAPNVERT